MPVLAAGLLYQDKVMFHRQHDLPLALPSAGLGRSLALSTQSSRLQECVHLQIDKVPGGLRNILAGIDIFPEGK